MAVGVEVKLWVGAVLILVAPDAKVEERRLRYSSCPGSDVGILVPEIPKDGPGEDEGDLGARNGRAG